MNKQELIKYFDELPYVSITQMGKKSFIDLIEQLDEPEKAKVPWFVAEYIKWAKKEDFHLLGAMNRENFDKKLYDWFYTDDNIEVFARAWLDGYEVGEEKRYEVILCNGQSLKTVYRQGEDRLDFEKVYSDLERFTRKQLEEANFGWAFDCPGIKIKEVEE